MKHFTLLKTWLIALVLMVFGAGGVMAQTYTHTIDKKTWFDWGAEVLSDVSWVAEGDGGYFGYTPDKGQQFGSAGNPCTFLTLKTSEINGTISSVKISTSGANNIKAVLSVSVGGVDFSPQSVDITNANTAYEFTGVGSGEVVISYDNPGADKKAIYVKEITIEYSESGTPCTSPALSFEEATITKSVAASSFTQIATSLNATTPIVYSSSKAEVATVNATTGEVTLVAVGSAVISASQAAGTHNEVEYCAGNASYTLTITVLPAPVAEEATAILSDGFTANWSEVEDAASYELIVYEKEQADGAAQLATNPGFEAWTDGKPDGWFGVRSNFTAENVVKYEASSQDGDYAVQLINASTSHKRFTTSAIQVTAEQEYAVTFWVRGRGDVRLGLFDGRVAGSGYAPYTSYINVETSDWEEYTLNVTAEVNTADGEFIFSLRNTNAEKDHLQIDNVTIAEVNKTTQKTVDGSPFAVTGTSKVLSGLKGSSDYFYRVKAIAGAYESALSDEVMVSTWKTGVNNQTEAHKVWVQDGKLIVNTDAAELVRVFDITGKKVAERTVTAGLNRITLRANGVYIVQLGDYIQKVIL